jgi:hypothetical protein
MWYMYIQETLTKVSDGWSRVARTTSNTGTQICHPTEPKPPIRPPRDECYLSYLTQRCAILWNKMIRGRQMSAFLHFLVKLLFYYKTVLG